MRRIYLDHAASTPMRKEVARVMAPHASAHFGNASSLHSFGQEAIAAVDHARETVAHAIGAGFREIIFTGSATEANNLALRGAMKKACDMIAKPRIILSAIEHESVLETARDLGREGVEVVVLPVDARGVVDLARLKKELNERTILVSVMSVNNEIGTVQPIQEIAKLVADFRKKNTYPLFHTDAVQAFSYFPCDANTLGVDMMTLSGHKIGGPKGVGCLYIRNTTLVAPIITGGGQEFGLRSGTEHTANIVGFAEAIRLAAKERAKERARLKTLKMYFWKNVKKLFPDAAIHGMDENHFKDASPHILNIAIKNLPIDDLLVRLDMAGIAASSGSACASRAATHSHVLSALFEGASRGVRFSFGRTTTKRELDEVLRRLRTIFPRS